MRDDLDRFNRMNRDHLAALIEEFLRMRLGPKVKPYGYTFRDRGTFEKRVEFVDPVSGKNWFVGTSSASLIFYGFARAPSRCMSEVKQLGREFNEWIGQQL